MSSNLLFFRSPGRISEVSRRNLNSRLFSIFLVVLGHLRLGATQWPQTQCVQIYPPRQFSRGCQWPHCFNLTSQLVFLFPPLPPAVHVHVQAEPSFKHVSQLTPLPSLMFSHGFPSRNAMACKAVSLVPTHFSDLTYYLSFTHLQHTGLSVPWTHQACCHGLTLFPH